MAKKITFKTKISNAFKGKVNDPSTKGLGIRSKIRTKVVDRGYEAILKQMEILEKEPYIKVGLPEESEETKEPYGDGKSGVTTLQVGTAHEFGTTKLPERSWLRTSHDAMVPEMNNLIAKLYGAILDGRITVSRALTIMGIKAESETKKFIYGNKVKPPSQKTESSGWSFTSVKTKYSMAPKADVPRTSFKTLIDTSQLVTSITFVKVMSGKRY